MKGSNFFKTLENDIKEKYHNEKVTYFDIFMSAIVFLMFAYEVSLSSFIYFYSNYAVYSLIIFIVLYFVFFHFVPKFLGRSTVMPLYKFLVVLFIAMVSFWTFPKIAHYIFLQKKPVCFPATLTYKLSVRKDEGRISFDIDNSQSPIPAKLMFLMHLSGIPYDTYRHLPEVGSPIRICGELSKVGFQYTSIEAVK